MKKKLSIALLAFSLAMLCANFIVRRVAKMLPPSQQEIEETEPYFSPFAEIKQESEENTENNEIINSTDLIVKNKRKQEDYTWIGTEFPQKEETGKEVIKPILKLELTEEEQKTIENYTKHPKLQAFINDLSTVISPEELEQENYLQIAFKPEVREIFIKYSQDEDFREIAETIIKDKNFLQFANKIIKNNEVKK